MAQPYLSVIIPAYNEADRLPLTLVDIDKHLSKVDYAYEILVVSDGSKDKTAEIARNMTFIRNLKVIDNEVNKGKGGVVRQGMLIARGKIRLFTDADNSTSIDQFEHMIPFFKEGYDVVIGSRALKESRLEPGEPWYRKIPGKIGNLIIQLLVLPGLNDTQCGFKAFSEEAAERIFSISKVSRFAFDVEALALAKRFGYRIKQIPVRWVNDLRSTVHASSYINFLMEVLKIRMWLWTEAYAKPQSSVHTTLLNDGPGNIAPK